MKPIYAALAILALGVSIGCHAQVPPASNGYAGRSHGYSATPKRQLARLWHGATAMHLCFLCGDGDGLVRSDDERELQRNHESGFSPDDAELHRHTHNWPHALLRRGDGAGSAKQRPVERGRSCCVARNPVGTSAPDSYATVCGIGTPKRITCASVGEETSIAGSADGQAGEVAHQI